jgi:RecJ-like exonuclease
VSRKKMKQAKADWENMGHRSADARDYSPSEEWSGGPCTECDGTGKQDEGGPCPICDGTGEQ